MSHICDVSFIWCESGSRVCLTSAINVQIINADQKFRIVLRVVDFIVD